MISAQFLTGLNPGGTAMAWFFTENEIIGDSLTISGENAKHIKVLRMKPGEALTLVTPGGTQCECELVSSDSDCASVKVVSKKPCRNEPDIEITLYQALPKSDKMDFIIQKSVELGVSKIVPMISERCVSRPDEKSLEKKRIRWQKIALQAAMQSRRGIIPEVCPCVSFEKAVELSRRNEKNIFFYEMGGEAVNKLLTEAPKTVGIFIGSEGGFSPGEAKLAKENNAPAATLGRRILRAETAPLAAITIIMYQTGNFD